MRKAVVLGLSCVLSASVALPASAIPAFARRYGISCSFCHEGFPKLNNNGKRFKERGFRMADEPAFKASEWIRSVPLVVRGQGNHTFVESFDDSNYGYLKGISAGNLGKHVSYWVDDSVLISEGDDTWSHVKPTNAWARIDILKNERLYLKAGRIELDLPFTQARTPHLFSYDVYFTNTGRETDNIGSYQDGAEIGGALPSDWRWSVAVVKGRNSEEALAATDEAGKFDANVFARISKRVNRNRFGAFTYIGRNTLYEPAGRLVYDDDLQRYGLDADVWIGRLNLYGVYMHGRNSNASARPSAPTGTHVAQTFDGGFAQADYHLKRIAALTARVNVVTTPASDLTNSVRETSTSFFPGIQIFIFQHGKASFEYGFLNQDRKGYGAVQLEFAF